MNLALTTCLLQLEESCKLSAYKDSLGVWTIGWGYNMVAHGIPESECRGTTWTQARADRELQVEIQAVVDELDTHWPEWRLLNDVRQAAAISSVYQLGAPKAAKFVATIEALRKEDWDAAAGQMLRSKWAKQTPNRVHRNALMFATGLWPTEVNGHPFRTAQDQPARQAAPQAEPGAPVLSAPVDKSPAPASSLDFLSVGAPLQAPRTLSIPLPSKKLSVAILVMALLALNAPLGLGIPPETQDQISSVAGKYLIGQSGVDALAPLFKPFIAPAVQRLLNGFGKQS